MYFVERDMFIKALQELGINPKEFEGQKLSLKNMAEIYDFQYDALLEAVQNSMLKVYYSYTEDTMWVDALEAAHFYYCVTSFHETFRPEKIRLL